MGKPRNLPLKGGRGESPARIVELRVRRAGGVPRFKPRGVFLDEVVRDDPIRARNDDVAESNMALRLGDMRNAARDPHHYHRFYFRKVFHQKRCTMRCHRGALVGKREGNAMVTATFGGNMTENVAPSALRHMLYGSIQHGLHRHVLFLEGGNEAVRNAFELDRRRNWGGSHEERAG
jgi:hypothetical protein